MYMYTRVTCVSAYNTIIIGLVIILLLLHYCIYLLLFRECVVNGRLADAILSPSQTLAHLLIEKLEVTESTSLGMKDQTEMEI